MRKIKFVNILEVDDKLRKRVREWRNKEEIRKSMLNQRIITEKRHFAWVESLRNRNDSKFWIVFVDRVPIGSVYLQNIDYEKLTSEWGFYIGEDSYRGKGLSKCILFKLLKVFFEEMKFEVLFTKVLSGSAVALNLYKKFNFEEMNKLSFKNQEKILLLKFSKKDWINKKEGLMLLCELQVASRKIAKKFSSFYNC